jgi:hypothetical protein
MKKELLLKHLKKACPIFLALLSVAISIASCKAAYYAIDQSKESNRLAKEALDNSKTLFYLDNRPYLIKGTVPRDRAWGQAPLEWKAGLWGAVREASVVMILLPD